MILGSKKIHAYYAELLSRFLACIGTSVPARNGPILFRSDMGIQGMVMPLVDDGS